MEKNQLHYGDNLTVLREHIKDESVDLIYLDPPFNSLQDYNVLFAERDGTRYPRIQILSIADLLEGKKIEYPRLLDVTYKKAPRVRGAAAEQQTLLSNPEEEGPL